MPSLLYLHHTALQQRCAFNALELCRNKEKPLPGKQSSIVKEEMVLTSILIEDNVNHLRPCIYKVMCRSSGTVERTMFVFYHWSLIFIKSVKAWTVRKEILVFSGHSQYNFLGPQGLLVRPCHLVLGTHGSPTMSFLSLFLLTSSLSFVTGLDSHTGMRRLLGSVFLPWAQLRCEKG